LVLAICVSRPRPTTGPASPIYAARKIPASASARCSGAVIEPAVAMAPLNMSPPAAPVTTAPATNTPRLGSGSQTASASRPNPASMAGIAGASRSRGERDSVTNCASAALAKVANEIAPASARD
jgi:hypothetical protein